MTDPQTLVFHEAIAAPVEQVYAAFSSSVALESWFADFAEVDLRAKGRFYCWWNVGYFASGLFTQVVENELISFTWNGLSEPHDTQVAVSFSPQDGGTLIKIQHGEIGAGSEWAERIVAYKKGWETGLTNLKSVMETGLDKRIYDRPMLGILVGEAVDAKKASELGLPLDYGAILGEVVESMGAEAAGLQKGDVLVSLNRHALKSFRDFVPALAKCKAGDVIEVVFYRAGDMRTVPMELSRRSAPKGTESAATLADATAAIYAEMSAEREVLFEGVSETQASARPAPGDWSAKETLVHLLYSERWLHFVISCAVGGQRAGGYSNQLELIAAVADVYPLSELLAELRRSEQVTVASLRALPPDFVADKRQFMRLASNLGLGFAEHSRDHLAQIKAALG